MMFMYILMGVLACILLYILFLSICSLLVNPHKEYEKESPFYRFLLNNATGIAIKFLRIRVHTTGLEKVPKDKQVLFVGNHRSNFDPIISWHVFRSWKPAFISKAANFKIPIFGRIIRKCCFMTIDRENPRNAIKTINKASELLKKGENSIAVYPEGTRSKTGTLLPFHNGVFKIAQKAQRDIVVLSVQGTEKIAKNYPFRTSHVYLDVLTVIPADEIKHKRTDEIGGYVRDKIENNLESTRRNA